MRILILLLAVCGIAVAIKKVDKNLTPRLKSGEKVDVIVTFSQTTEKILKSVEKRAFKTRAERLNTLVTSLQSLTQDSQKSVAQYLTEEKIEFESYWISNQILVKNADEKTIKKISSFPEVKRVSEEIIITLEDTLKHNRPEKAEEAPAIQWGIEKIEAPTAWRASTGVGVVVANIDSGVHVTHEALKYAYRGGNHSWFDPTSQSELPFDNHGHGTHTMGTIVGANGYGVAPDAQWIACRGCPSSCPQRTLTACAQWVLCPTRFDGSDPDCSKAPKIVSNSWGSSGGNYWFETHTEAWIAGGILPVFSIGNDGNDCVSAGSPGDFRRVIGVGATDDYDEIATFSGVGPTMEGRPKPEISAPGVNIRSSLPTSDTAYGLMSGTSMACPHAAGVAALAYSLKPNMTFAQARKVLLAGVDTDLTSRNRACHWISDRQFPNYYFGFGRINALKAVKEAQQI